MGRFGKILLVCAALVLAYFVAVGLGLTNSGAKKRRKPLLVLNDFEKPETDFGFQTGGYVLLDATREQRTKGKTAAKAVFLPASQFFPVPTPGVAWEPSLTLTYETPTQLSETDWSSYETLKLDVFNPMDHLVPVRVRVADARTSVFEHTADLLPGKVANLEIPLDGPRAARLDLAQVRALTFAVDASKEQEPVTLVLDYIRLEGSARKKGPRDR